MLDRKEMVTLAAKLMKLSETEIEANSAMVDDKTLYFSMPYKGGDSLIVSNDGTVLYASSAVGYSKHMDEFNNGRRTPLEEFI